VTAVNPEASRQAAVEGALLVLERMGPSPADLTFIRLVRTRRVT
jgi:hypothetical protein